MATSISYTPRQHPTDSVLNENLAKIKDAIRKLSDAIPDAAAETLVFIGELTAAGSLTLPAKWRRLRICTTGDSQATGGVNATFDNIVAGYNWGFDGAAPVALAAFPLYLDAAAGGEFESNAEVAASPSNVFYRLSWASVATLGFSGSGGFVAAPQPSVLKVTAALNNSFKVSVSAEVGA